MKIKQEVFQSIFKLTLKGWRETVILETEESGSVQKEL